MRANEIVLRLLRERGMSQRSLARLVGLPPQTVNNQLVKADSMKLDAFVSMLDALDYELKIVPKAVGRSEYVLSATAEGVAPRRAVDRPRPAPESLHSARVGLGSDADKGVERGRLEGRKTKKEKP